MTDILQETFSEYDRELKHLLTRTRGPAEAVVHAVMRKAADKELPLPEVRHWMKDRSNWIDNRSCSDAWLKRQGFDEEAGSSRNGATVKGSRPALRDLINQNRYWNRLSEEVERMVVSSPSLLGDFRAARMITARRLYGRLLLPFPEGSSRLLARNLNGRVAYACIAKLMNADALKREELRQQAGVSAQAQMLMAEISQDRGDPKAEQLMAEAKKENKRAAKIIARDTEHVSRPKLAAMVGWSIPGAGDNLKYLESIGLIRNTRQSSHAGKSAKAKSPGSGRGVIGRFRLVALTGGGSSLQRWEHSIDAYLDGRPDALADVIRNVDHATFGYSGTFNHKHWLVLLAYSAHVPVSRFGMRRATELQVIRDLEAVELIAQVPESKQYLVNGNELVEILDRLATVPDYGKSDSESGGMRSAGERKNAAMARWVANAEARRKGAAVIRTRKSEAHAWIADILKANPLSKVASDSSPAERLKLQNRTDKWSRSVRTVIEADRPAPDIREIARSRIRSWLLTRGYGESLANGIAGDAVRVGHL